ncbi:hypothetical protein FRC09_013206 [Ceratobasidium sp. 395]|nr:hypothetical protein FRC09_013206 [Ceratobasidium sp. 395]
MTHPSNSLPPEILACIFTQASCRCNSYLDYDDIPSPILNPISYSAVCKHWRQVAVGHQSLWTHIDLVVNVIDKDGKYYSPEVWLERSRGAPLSVQVLQPRFSLNGEYLEQEEEESMTIAFPDPDQVPAPMVNRLVNFLTPLMPQVRSLTTFLSYPYESTLKLLLDCWKTYGTPGQAKALKTLSNMELAHITIRLPKAYTSFLESLEVLHLHNTVLKSWSSFLFPNLIEFKTSVGEGEWSIALPKLAGILSSCPKLRRLLLNGLRVKPFPTSRPKPILLQDLRELGISVYGDTHETDRAATTLEYVLDMIIPGQDALDLELSLPGISKSPQRAINAVCAFVQRTNVTQLRVYGCQVTGFEDNPYFASQLGPLPRVQTLTLEEFYFCDVVRVESRLLNFEDDSSLNLDEHNNPRPINPELVLWPDVRNLYLCQCVLEEEHLCHLVSLHSVQALYMQGCLNNIPATSESAAEPDTWFESRRDMEHYIQPLVQFVPKVVPDAAWDIC